MVESKICPKVQLFISCRKLKDTDMLSKSDPFVEVFEKRQNQWAKLGNTEVIENNLNPDFVTNFTVNYLFEEQQGYKFRVFDSDNGKASTGSRNFIGECEATLGEIIGSRGQQAIKTLRASANGKSVGNIILRCEMVSDNNDSIVFQFTGREFEDHSGIFHSNKPFFYLSRAMESGGNQRVYMSEHSGGKIVNWKPVTKSLKDLCNGDPTRPIIFDLYDHHRSGNHDYLASAEFSIHKITEENCKELILINPKKKTKKGYKHSGIVTISQCQIIKNYSLLDYIRGGCQISLVVAVDFTASNGIPTNPQSLHFMNPSGMNQYEQALFAVSEILLNYDSDKQVPMYGFGGKINGQTSHCFHMNFNPNNPCVFGIEGIMAAYRNSLRYVELNGPTLFGHFLSKIVSEVEAQQVSQNNQQYTVLLILTDGEIHDMSETVNWIVRGSFQPLSVVIVGIGNDSFQNMRTLDADDTPLMDSKGIKMQRDIVQFVPFREVNNSAARLAKEVLEEIPREVSNFFKMRNIYPNVPIEPQAFDFERSYTVKQEFDPASQNIAPQAFAPQMAPQGYAPQNAPPQAFPPQMAPQGYVPQTFPPQGFPPQMPPQGYPPQAPIPNGGPQMYSTIPSKGFSNVPPYPPQGFPQQSYQTLPPQGFPPKSNQPQVYDYIPPSP